MKRAVALTRKNALFASSSRGAGNRAMPTSLLETCKLNSANPEAYFTDVLTKLVNNWPNCRLAELLPWAWTTDTRFDTRWAMPVREWKCSRRPQWVPPVGPIVRVILDACGSPC